MFGIQQPASFEFGAHLPMGGRGGTTKHQEEAQAKLEYRKTTFKGTEMNSKQKRGQETITLRKNTREKVMEQRRAACGPKAPTAAPSSVPDLKMDPDQQLHRYAQMLHNIPAELTSDQQRILTDALIHMREWSRVPRFPMADKILKAKLCSPLMKLYHSQNGNITNVMATEAVWILNNLSSVSASAVQEMVLLGIIDLIYPCMVKPRSHDHFENSVWLLANICGRHPDYRDQVQKNAVAVILQLTKNESTIRSMSVPALAQISFLIRNICRVWERDRDQAEIKASGLPPFGGTDYRFSDFHFTKRFGPMLWLLCNHADHQVILNSVEAFRHLLFDITDGKDTKDKNVHIQELLTHFPGLVALLVKFISHPAPAVVTEALYCLAHIASGNDNHAQAVIDAGAMSATLHVLSPPIRKRHKSREVAIRGYFLISNIAGGLSSQISAFLNTKIQDEEGKNWSGVTMLLHDLSYGMSSVAFETCNVLVNLVNRSCLDNLPSDHPEYIERMKHFVQIMQTTREEKDVTSWIVSGLISRISQVDTVTIDFLDVGLRIIENLLYLGQYRSRRPNSVPEYVPVTSDSVQNNKMFYDMEATNGFELLSLLRTNNPNPKVYKKADDLLRVFNDKFLQDEFDGPDDLDEDDDEGDVVETFTRTVLPTINSGLNDPPHLGSAPDMKYGGNGYAFYHSDSSVPPSNPNSNSFAFGPPPRPSQSMIVPPPPFSRQPTFGENNNNNNNEMRDN